MHDKRQLKMLEREEEMMYDPRFRPLVPRDGMYDTHSRPLVPRDGIHFNIITPHARQGPPQVDGGVNNAPPQSICQSRSALQLPGLSESHDYIREPIGTPPASESHDYIREPIGTPPPPYDSVIGLCDPLSVGYGSSMQTVLVSGQSEYHSHISDMV